MNFDNACAKFEALPSQLQIPSLHPCYIRADAQTDPSAKEEFFFYEDAGSVWYHGFHLRNIPNTDFFDVQSPYGYGGPVGTSQDPNFLHTAWQAWTQWCVQHNVMAEFARFHPLLGNWIFFHGDIHKNRSTVVIDLEDNLMAGYKTRVRTTIRKAIKHELQFRWATTVQEQQEFIKHYYEEMRRINAAQSYFFPSSYFSYLFACPGTRLGVCELAGETLACAIFLIRGEYMEYHLSAATDYGRKLGAVNLLLHSAALEGQRAGVRRFHLGGGFDSSPDNPLLFFKSGFSPATAEFRIGSKIHLNEEYQQMKKRWEVDQASVSDKILFYRF